MIPTPKTPPPTNHSPAAASDRRKSRSDSHTAHPAGAPRGAHPCRSAPAARTDRLLAVGHQLGHVLQRPADKTDHLHSLVLRHARQERIQPGDRDLLRRQRLLAPGPAQKLDDAHRDRVGIVMPRLDGVVGSRVISTLVRTLGHEIFITAKRSKDCFMNTEQDGCCSRI